MNDRSQTLIRPWLLVTLSTVLLSAGAWQLYQSDLGYWNVGYFTNAKTALNIDLTELRGKQSMSQLKKQYPELDWYCRTDGTGIGSTICVDDQIKSWNANPAMAASFYFAKDELTHIALQVPQWEHFKTKEYLIALLGQPHARDRNGFFKPDLVVWNLQSGGGIVFNLDPDPIPLQWSTVFWYSPDAVNRNGGLIRRGNQAVEE